MKVLLLGGTGAMGVHLANMLSDDNIETYITSRKNRNNYGTVHYIIGNAHDDSFIESMLKKHFDVIVDFMVYSTSEFKNRVEMFLENCEQYIFLSSSRVYADSNAPITENSPRLLDISDDLEFLATDDYALKKARQENILSNSKRKNWTIIRPYITYSDIRLQFGVLEKEIWLKRVMSGKTVVFSEDIFNHKTTLTNGYDVANGIRAIIGKTTAFGECFHITNSESLLWSEVWEIYKNVLIDINGVEPGLKLIDLKTFYKIYPGEYQVKYDRLFDRVFDNSKINNFLNTNDFISTKEGLEKSLRLFIKNGACFDFSYWRVEGAADRITGDVTNLKDITGFKNKARYILGKGGIHLLSIHS